jgi:hypothetical protein
MTPAPHPPSAVRLPAGNGGEFGNRLAGSQQLDIKGGM